MPCCRPIATRPTSGSAASCTPQCPVPTVTIHHCEHGEHAIPSRAATDPICVLKHPATPPSALGGLPTSARAPHGAWLGAPGGAKFLGATRQAAHRARGRRTGATARAAAAREQQQRRRLGSKLQRPVIEPRVEAFDPSRLRTAIQVGQQSARNQRLAKGRESKTLATGVGAVSNGFSSTLSRSFRLFSNYVCDRSFLQIVVNRRDQRGVRTRRRDLKSTCTLTAGGHQRLWGPPDGGQGAAPVESLHGADSLIVAPPGRRSASTP